MRINKNSITIKIGLIFLVSIITLACFFTYYFYNQKKIEIFKAKDRHIRTIHTAMWLMNHHNQSLDETNRYFLDFGLDAVMEKEERDEILRNGKRWFDIDTRKAQIDIFEYKQELYILVQGRYIDMIYKDIFFSVGMNKNFIFLIIGAMFIVTLTYFWVLKSLYPLKILRENIRKFADGDMQIESKSDKKDEIAEVANEFDRAVKKINSLIRSRKFFLRATMHELKTPITKGRLVLEMIDEGKQRDRLGNIFDRLENLIFEFATIEQFESKNYELNIKKERVSDMLKSAIDRLLLDDYTKEIDIESCDEIFVDADRDFFILALKNLLDNALKYRQSGAVFIIYNKESLSVSSIGERIDGDIEDYFTPFYKRDINSRGKLGLGLYIIKNILDEHNFVLEYKYDKNRNIFSIVF